MWWHMAGVVSATLYCQDTVRILSQRKERKPRVPRGAHVLPPERIAKWLRYCRNYAHKTQKRPCMDAGARRTAPRTARFDGFVKHRNPSSIISYSILATQRSDGRSTCAPVVPRACVPYYYINVLNKVFNAFC